MARESFYAVALDVEEDYDPDGKFPKNTLWHTALGPVFVSGMDAVSYAAGSASLPAKANLVFEVQVTRYDIHTSVEYIRI